MSVPAALAKHGITRVVSNLGEDEEIVLPAGLLFTLFGKELMERLAPKPKSPPEKQRRMLCRPKDDCL